MTPPKRAPPPPDSPSNSDSDDDLDSASMTSAQEYELDNGIPQPSDPFIQKYYSGRAALIAQEKKQRHDVLFKRSMTPLARQAARILARMRKRELREVWGGEVGLLDAEMGVGDEGLGNGSGVQVHHGMMFGLARKRMEGTDVWRCLERMPKGALLHAHLDAMIDVEWMVDQALAEKGLCLIGIADGCLSSREKRDANVPEVRFFADARLKTLREGLSASEADLWSEKYKQGTPVPIREAQRMFPDDATTFKKWVVQRATVTMEESLDHHHGLDAVWRKFQSCFFVLGQFLFYEPIFRKALARLLGQLAADGITYVDFRVAFKFEWRPTGSSTGEDGNYENFFRAFGEEIEKFKGSEVGKKNGFRGARMIWTVVRINDTRTLAESMKECIRIKKIMPHLICGFDFVGQEDKGRTLADLTPLVFWFRKQCMEAGVEIPFFFHAGECLGDGNDTDNNLFDAILLGTRRVGHGYALYKHPLLLDMVKDKKILVENCPISNEVLRLSSTILQHSMPALLARGVPMSLNNDDPAILGHGKNGLTHDFWQSFMAFENLGLEGLGVMAENSLKWSAVEDQKSAEWLKGIQEAYMGKTVKAAMLKEWRREFEKWCQWVVLEFPLEADSDDEGGDDEEDDDEDDSEDD
jgi:adenosine deaminase CECR1